MKVEKYEQIIVWITRTLCISAILIGFLVILGWTVGNIFLMGIKITYVPMAPNTAVLFIALGTVCYLLTTKTKNDYVVYPILLTAFAMSSMRLLEMLEILGTKSSYWFFDFASPATNQFGFPIAQTAFPTTVAFLCLITALLFMKAHHKLALSEIFSAALATAAMWIGLMFFLGYLYENPLLYGGSTIPMAMNTALSFVLLSSAVINLAVGREILERKKTEEEMENAKKRFLSMISHELRTPLTPIRAHLELLLAKKFTEKERKQSLQVILRNAKRLNVLINDLLDATRIQSGNLKIYKKTGDLSSVIDQAIEIVNPLATDNNIKITKSIQKPDTAELDKDRILQVLINLLNNAIKHSGGKNIGITSYTEDGYVTVSVQDDGNGMTQEQKQKLFNPFTASKESAASKGAGLGLYICKSIIEQHNGKIWVETGKGTKFIFTIPGDKK